MKNLLKINPEFARNITLEFSLQRLVIMPLVLILLSMLIIFNVHEETYHVLHYSAMGVYVFITMVWGLKSASEAVLDEYNDKTWDWQRMTVIGPWKLAWGKLFGSTIYQWYGGLICMVIFFITSVDFTEPGNEIELGIILIAGAITMHGIMILYSLMLMRKGDGRAKIRSTRVFIIGLLIISLCWRPFTSGLMNSFGNRFDVSWYGISGKGDVSLISILFYGSWVIAGLYRCMRAELQYSDKPKYWAVFLATNIVFTFGYVAGTVGLGLAGKIAATLMICFSEMLIFVYILGITEPKDVVNFSLILENFRKKNYDPVLRNTPLWPVTFVLTVISGLFAVIFILLSLHEPSQEFNWFDLNFQALGPLKIVMLFIAIICFMVRDFSILLLLNFSQRSRHADGAMVLYLAILYALLPALASKTDIGVVFYPAVHGDAFIMALVPFIEAAIAGVFLVRRWKEIN
jgi:hypothetical protein